MSDPFFSHAGPSEFIALVNSIPPSLFSPDSPHYIAGPSSSTQYQKLALANPSFAVLANKLSFLPAFRDFLEAYAADERQRAADLLVRMLVSGIAPVGFWAVLLVDAVPLLEGGSSLSVMPLGSISLADCMALYSFRPGDADLHGRRVRASSAPRGGCLGVDALAFGLPQPSLKPPVFVLCEEEAEEADRSVAQRNQGVWSTTRRRDGRCWRGLSGGGICGCAQGARGCPAGACPIPGAGDSWLMR